MYEIRLHGYGGEGVVRLSEIIGKAATDAGKWAHSFPFFGTEIRGAAVKSFTRVDDEPITIKSYIYEPDVLLVTNEILLDDESVTAGLRPESWLLVNSARSKEELEQKYKCRALPVNATNIGYEIIGKPIVNTVMLGALVAATGVISMEEAEEILKQEFNGKLAEVNIKAARRGYEEARRLIS